MNITICKLNLNEKIIILNENYLQKVIKGRAALRLVQIENVLRVAS
jgi:hypothetical protein